MENVMSRMTVTIGSLLFATLLGAATPPAKLTGDVTVATSPSGRSAVVVVKASGGKEVAAQFCIDLAEPLAQPLALKRAGTVIYVPQPIEGLPPGVKISGPEQIAPTLAVVPVNGPAILFAKKGTPAPSGVDAKKARTVAVTTVRRQDWVGPNGARRGTSVEGCLSPGG
jgi:hypothetical protein